MRFVQHVHMEDLTVDRINFQESLVNSKIIDRGLEFGSPTEFLAIDCEMEGAAFPVSSTPIRVSITN